MVDNVPSVATAAVHPYLEWPGPIPFAHRGVECLTFASGSLGRATMAIHSSGDVADHVILN